MRTTLREAVATAGVLLLCAGGTAWASTTTVAEANVPFPFVVNGRTFQPGKYAIERDDTSPEIFVIRGEKGDRETAILSTVQDGGRDPAGSHSVLTFKRHENQYELSSIWQSRDEGWDVVNRSR